jgi:hypothetical protein
MVEGLFNLIDFYEDIFVHIRFAHAKVFARKNHTCKTHAKAFARKNHTCETHAKAFARKNHTCETHAKAFARKNHTCETDSLQFPIPLTRSCPQITNPDRTSYQATVFLSANSSCELNVEGYFEVTKANDRQVPYSAVLTPRPPKD